MLYFHFFPSNYFNSIIKLNNPLYGKIFLKLHSLILEGQCFNCFSYFRLFKELFGFRKYFKLLYFKNILKKKRKEEYAVTKAIGCIILRIFFSLLFLFQFFIKFFLFLSLILTNSASVFRIFVSNLTLFFLGLKHIFIKESIPFLFVKVNNY